MTDRDQRELLARADRAAKTLSSEARSLADILAGRPATQQLAAVEMAVKRRRS